MNSKSSNSGFMGILIFFIMLVAVVITVAMVGVKTYFPSQAKALADQVSHYPKFKKCINNACTQIEGIGFDSCQADVDCH